MRITYHIAGASIGIWGEEHKHSVHSTLPSSRGPELNLWTDGSYDQLGQWYWFQSTDSILRWFLPLHVCSLCLELSPTFCLICLLSLSVVDYSVLLLFFSTHHITWGSTVPAHTSSFSFPFSCWISLSSLNINYLSSHDVTSANEQ